MKAFYLSLLLLILGNAPGYAVEIKFEFDLIDIDEEVIVEPPGVLEFTVNIDTTGYPNGKNPLTSQILHDAASDGLKEVRDILKEQIKDTNNSIKLALATAKKEKSYGASLKEEINRHLTVMESTFEAISEQAYYQAEADIRKKWTDLLERHDERKAWKLEVAYAVASNTFGLAVETAAAIGTGGASLALDIIGMVDRSVTLAKTLKSAAVSEKKARKDLLNAAKAVERKIHPTTKLTKGERLKDKYAGLENKLEEAMAFHRIKLEVVNRKARSLAASLDRSFAAEAKLRLIPEARDDADMQAALRKIEESRVKYLEGISKLTEAINTADMLQEKVKLLLVAARQDNPSKTTIEDVVGYAKYVFSAATAIEGAIEPAISLLTDSLDLIKDTKGQITKFRKKHKNI